LILTNASLANSIGVLAIDVQFGEKAASLFEINLLETY
jgi:hypothetical protein